MPTDRDLRDVVAPYADDVGRLNDLADRWNKAASAASFCGSEYIDEPERVFERVTQSRTAQMEALRRAKAEDALLRRKAAAFDWLEDSRCGRVECRHVGTPGDDAIEWDVIDVDDDVMATRDTLLEAVEAAMREQEPQL